MEATAGFRFRVLEKEGIDNETERTLFEWRRYRGDPTHI